MVLGIVALLNNCIFYNKKIFWLKHGLFRPTRMCLKKWLEMPSSSNVFAKFAVKAHILTQIITKTYLQLNVCVYVCVWLYACVWDMCVWYLGYPYSENKNILLAWLSNIPNYWLLIIATANNGMGISMNIVGPMSKSDFLLVSQYLIVCVWGLLTHIVIRTYLQLHAHNQILWYK